MKPGYLDRLAARAQETTEMARPLVAPLYAPRAGAAHAMDAARVAGAPLLATQEDEVGTIHRTQHKSQSQSIVPHREPLQQEYRQGERFTSQRETYAMQETLQPVTPRVEAPVTWMAAGQATKTAASTNKEETESGSRPTRTASTRLTSSNQIRETFASPVDGERDLPTLVATPALSPRLQNSPIATPLATLATPRAQHGHTAAPTSLHRRESPQVPAAPSIHISIGRVEIRAVQAAPVKPAAAPTPQPSLSIGDYLKQREARR